jgi:hypothetical protein
MKVINFILFQTAWLVTLFSAAYGKPYIGIIFTALWMTYHLFIACKQPKNEMMLLVIVAVLGWLLELSLVMSQLVSYPEQTMIGLLVPLWMVALWVNLTATINFSLSWMNGRYFLAALFAAIAGPLSYFAGERIGAIILHGYASLIAICLMWFFAMPFIFWLNNWIMEAKNLKQQIIPNGAE